jgi:colanic acid biosynthesis glycosyl transferase WcaI
LMIARLRGMRFVALMQDIYPDIAVALGTLRADSLLTRTLDWFSRLVLRSADRIIVLSECMRERIVAKIDAESESRIDVIHNWADGAMITPLENRENPFRLEHNLQDEFIVMYSGNWGLVNEFQTVLEAARMVRERKDIVFLFIGDGVKANEIRAYCQAHDLPNVRLLPYQPRKYLRFSLAAADVALVTLAEGLAGLCVPSKTYGIMAAGRPLLFVGDQSSEIARIITESRCGDSVSAGQSQELASLLSKWSTDKATLNEFGRRARAVFASRFDRSHAVSAYICMLNKCLSLADSTTAEFDNHTVVAEE